MDDRLQSHFPPHGADFSAFPAGAELEASRGFERMDLAASLLDHGLVFADRLRGTELNTPMAALNAKIPGKERVSFKRQRRDDGVKIQPVSE